MLSSHLLHQQFLIYTCFLKHLTVLYPCIWKSCDHQTLSSLIFILKCLSFDCKGCHVTHIHPPVLMNISPPNLFRILLHQTLSLFGIFNFSLSPASFAQLKHLFLSPFLGKTISSLKPMYCFDYHLYLLSNQIFWKVVYKFFAYFCMCSFLFSPSQPAFSTIAETAH